MKEVYRSSVDKCNEQGGCQGKYLGRQEDDSPRCAPCGVFEDYLVVLVAVVEIARCGRLHLSKVGIVCLRRLKQLATEQADMNTARKQGSAALTHTQRICHRSNTERDRHTSRPVTNREGGNRNDYRRRCKNGGCLLPKLCLGLFLRSNGCVGKFERKFLWGCGHYNKLRAA